MRDIYKYVDKLRAKHGRERWKEPFPDLSTDPNPCTNGFGLRGEVYSPPHAKPKTNLIVDTLHKQGMMVLSKSELPWAGGKKP